MWEGSWMRRAVVILLLGSLPAAAAAAEAAACSVRKGLYDEWLSSEKRVGGLRTALKGALVSGSAAPAPDEAKQETIGQQYRAFFQCISDASEQADATALQSSCKDAADDMVASLVCQTVLYLKGGRMESKEFVEALPGKKGAELVWELDTIAATAPDKTPAPAIFLPKGPAYKLLDELFLLVLDGKAGAAGKYLAIAAAASGDAVRHTDDQFKVLLREAPAVVVQEWPLLRQYQPRLKKLMAELGSSLTAAEMQQMRRGLAAFCTKDNLDCPEILKVLGR